MHLIYIFPSDNNAIIILSILYKYKEISWLYFLNSCIVIMHIYPVFIYSSILRLLGYFQIHHIVNCGAINLGVQMPFLNFDVWPLGFILRSSIAVSYEAKILEFWSNLYIDFRKRLDQSTFPWAVTEKINKCLKILYSQDLSFFNCYAVLIIINL